MDLRGRTEIMQWLFWQMAGLGPMAGQNSHFANYAPEKIPYAINRYVKETERLYGVLDQRLADREFIAGVYSIADMAAYPWIVPHERQGQDLNDFPNLKRWFETVQPRDAVQRAYAVAKTINTTPTVTEESKSILSDRGGGQDEMLPYLSSILKLELFAVQGSRTSLQESPCEKSALHGSPAPHVRSIV